MGILGLASGAIGAVGSALGTANERNKQKRRIMGLTRLRYDDKAETDKDIYENPLERHAAQAFIRRSMDALRRMNESAAKTNTVSGASEQTMFNKMQASADALGNQMSDIAIAADEDNRRLKQQYLDRDAKRREMLIDEESKMPTGLDMAKGMIEGFGKGARKFS